MLKKLMALIILGIITLASIPACHTAGEATGEGVEQTKEGAHEFERGYEEGKQ